MNSDSSDFDAPSCVEVLNSRLFPAPSTLALDSLWRDIT